MTGPVMLVVLDGYGIGDGGEADATAVAHSPFVEHIRRDHPSARIETSGESVGLPVGQMGNSEVGHMTLGAGRIIDQDLTRITKAFEAGAMQTNPAIQQTLEAVEASGGTLHLIGLVSDGGVHSHTDHLISILEGCRARGVSAAVHALLDGRDTPPQSALRFIGDLQPHIDRNGAHLATVIGRYYAMDRDKRWDRVGRAYDAIVRREGVPAASGIEAVEAAYARNESDEFVTPTVIEGGAPLADGDAVFFFNFRSDRAREITSMLSGVGADAFEESFERKQVPALSAYLCLTEYAKDFELPVAFEADRPTQVLGEVLAERSLPQLRIAETEKYAHVTFFFNCGREEPFAGEHRVLIPSPRDVPTYDHKPEMSAIQLTDALVEQLQGQRYAFILVNYANPDMVGHTGDLSAAVKAVETIDLCLQRVAQVVLDLGGHMLITADHGNCEQMVDPETGGPHTAHTTNRVPIYWVTEDPQGRSIRDGGLADIAPTVLELMGLSIPTEMEGHSLLD